jgi:hypothetical protein
VRPFAGVDYVGPEDLGEAGVVSRPEDVGLHRAGRHAELAAYLFVGLTLVGLLFQKQCHHLELALGEYLRELLEEQDGALVLEELPLGGDRARRAPAQVLPRDAVESFEVAGSA